MTITKRQKLNWQLKEVSRLKKDYDKSRAVLNEMIRDLFETDPSLKLVELEVITTEDFTIGHDPEEDESCFVTKTIKRRGGMKQ